MVRITKDNSNREFTVPDSRFDQENEMYKQPIWDEKVKHPAMKFHRDTVVENNAGYCETDFAFRYGAWGFETSAALGDQRTKNGL